MTEATKDQLQEQIEQLKKDLTTVNSVLDITTKSKAQTDKELASLKQQNTELQNQLTDERTRSGEVAGELNEAQDLIEDLQKRLDTAASLQAQSDTVIVSDGTDHYKVLAPKFRHKKVEYAAEQLRDNETLVRELVAAGVGFLHKINAGE